MDLYSLGLGNNLIEFLLLITLLIIEYLFIIIGALYYLRYKPKKLNTISNPKNTKSTVLITGEQGRPLQNIKSGKTVTDKDTLSLLKKIDRVPELQTKITCIILRENKFAKIFYFDGSTNDFTYGKCLYFIDATHTCDNGAKILVYLEGVSLPISCENIQKEKVKRTYIDANGESQTVDITVIKNLKWDGKILYIYTNRKFAENFTSNNTDNLILIILIVGIITLIIGCIGIAISYFIH